MRRHIAAKNGPRRWGGLLAAAGLAGLGLCGCGLTWDDVSARDFHIKDAFAKAPDPLDVLKDSKDGDKRARAFRALKEPKPQGGSDHDQEFVLALLATAVKKEPSYYARLEAMRKLGEFKDPRAVPCLIEAYYQIDSLLANDARDHTITRDLIATYRCEVLRGLGINRGPEADTKAVEMLVNKLKQPLPDKTKAPAADVRMVMDERITAARALRSYPQYQATNALVLVLKNDTDVALRDCATESLQACTGQKLPAEYAAWAEFLDHQPKTGEAIAADKKKYWTETILTGWFGIKP